MKGLWSAEKIIALVRKGLEDGFAGPRYTAEDVDNYLRKNDERWRKASQILRVVQEDEFGNHNVLPVVSVEQTLAGTIVKVG